MPLFSKPLFLALCLLTALLPPAKAQLLKPATWVANLEPANPRPGQMAEIVLTTTIQAGWHVYATDFSPEVGPNPLVITLAPHPSFSLVGKPVSVASHHQHDDVFDGEVALWERSGQARQKIKVLSTPLYVAVNIDGQVCTDAGKCVPFFEDFTLTSRAASSPQGKTVLADAPTSVNKPGTGLPANPLSRESTPTSSLAPADSISATTPDATPDAASPTAPDATPDATPDAKPATTSDALAAIPESSASTSTQAAMGVTNGMPQGLWAWFWLAFGSGLLALLTPCVYPMVPMTVSFFTRQGQTRARGFGLAAVFGLSIVSLYVLIGVVVSRLFGGDAANEIATHWLPNVLFFVIFLTFGFSFLGYFEITLPSSWSTAADERAEKGGLVGIFFMALTLVVVSFSCTGPIASSILLQSAQGAVVQPVVAMLGFSLAFALPFSFFAAFPQALQALPRSGTWMNSVKVVLGFLELALALKFLSVADLAYHWHLLNRDVYLALWIVIFSMLGLYLLGKLRFPHDSPGERPVGWPALVLSIATFAFVVYLIPGLWGAPLRPLSGYLPPLETQEFRPQAGGAAGGVSSSAMPATGCPIPRYADFLHLPHGLQGYFDLDQALACAKAQNKPVFIDFTGHGCTNCREMEARVWSDPAVLQRLQSKFVVCALYVDDRTALPTTEQYISKVDGKLKATIGKKNLDIEVARFNSNAQPQYVVLSPEGKLLAGPRAYDLRIPGFVAFLDQALAASATSATTAPVATSATTAPVATSATTAP